MKSISIVEDEAPLLVLAESILETAGYRTLSAASLAQAQAILHSDAQFDLIFTDVGLGELREGGLQLGQTARDTRPGIPILYTSGMTLTDGMKSLFVEPCAFMPKPYRDADRLGHIDQLLSANPAANA